MSDNNSPSTDPVQEKSPQDNQAPEKSAFEALGLAKPIWQKLVRLKYDVPSDIQAQAIPEILAGHDVMGLAQTGTGKTAAFTLPLLHRLMKNAPAAEKSGYIEHSIRALILTPTRELAQQIDKSVRNYGENLSTRSGCVVGGVHAHKQKKMLKGGIDILVATPGRLEDLMSQGVIDLKQVETVILDEADQMLDIGFLPAIKRILGQTPKSRQTLLFSATMPKQIRELTQRYMRNPKPISVSPPSSTVTKVSQSVMFIDQPKKTDALTALLAKYKQKRVIVFTRTKRGADRIAKRLIKCNLPAVAIHGNRSQNQRTRALNDFRNSELHILVATDVAARGIDIPEVELVVNFDLPQVAESYVHRIGRTGRAGRSGQAIMFCNPEEMKLLADIEKVIKKNIPERMVDGTVKPEATWSPDPRAYNRPRPNADGSTSDAENGNSPDMYKQRHGTSRNRPQEGQSAGQGEKRSGKKQKPSRRSRKNSGGNPQQQGGAPKNASQGSAQSGDNPRPKKKRNRNRAKPSGRPST